ncbi:MAG: decarboxylating NADP(+)-dependent phosphogluconate dehydrogenase [SAR324 cluster bacterium]|uniref:6-phosphogluconate dehydrogenase, decarboxylating n=1 Tax=SAR324 cluster bacterium TaxID=2024889 RepID=A0A7X9FPX3_9DELT|nr:decarboxylating NADP(+)-dependent phosphogluconate dehydrogenase [SAR324 cluster bacterium]
MALADVGLIGLAVMGENLVLNMERNGFKVAVFNRSPDKVTHFVSGLAAGKNIVGAKDLRDFIDLLSKPRKIILMVKAGPAVDQLILQLRPFLEEGDLIIDGGNSHYKDTQRRSTELESAGILFSGTGISGGEDGALHGPSIMPGGSKKAWDLAAPIFEKIAAKAEDGSPCCAWIGPDGAGHFVKMVHNGIEYADMQLITEAFFLMKTLLDLNANELHEVFRIWNASRLNSYLIEITAKIFLVKDPDTGRPLIDLILDRAAQKGTGKWTTESALELGVPTPMFSEAVFARSMSALKAERVYASSILPGPRVKKLKRDSFLNSVEHALFASKICSYAQGFALMKQASEEYRWRLDLSKIALIWRNGCIIRSQFLELIATAFAENNKLNNLLIAPYFKDVLFTAQSSWRDVICTATKYGIPIPAFASALSYYDSYRQDVLAANLIQAQRDFFGAHSYERVDKEGTFHTNWELMAKNP